MPFFESMPIVFALDASGALRHVDDVPNGLACGCTCPDPRCGQPLVARNNGKKLIHHFAHKRGTCEWSIEHVLSTLALKAVSSAGCMSFPRLEYYDAMKDRFVELSPACPLRVSKATLEHASGRGAPELFVTCTAGGKEKQFAVVISLIHSLKESELEKLCSSGVDVVLVDLQASLRSRKRAAGRHFDRAAIFAEYQDARFVEWLLLDKEYPFKKWAVNAKRASAEAESAERKRAWQAEQDRKAAERERRRREQEKVQAEQRARQRSEENRRRMELERQRAERIAAEGAEAARLRAVRRAEEKSAWQEAQKRAFAEVLEQIDQQEHQVRDVFGQRWVRCKRCGEVKLVDEFQSYGGPGRINLGICYDCARTCNEPSPSSSA